MRTQSVPRSSSLALALLATMVAAFTSCASSGTPSQRTVTVSERLTGEFEALGANANAVSAAVDKLRDSVETTGIINREKVAVGDIEGSFKEFRKAVDGVRSSKRQLESSRKSLQSAMDQYLATWDKDIASYESEDLKRRSQERRDDGQARFVRVTAELEKGGQEVNAYIGRLTELQSALANDLTPAGVGNLDDMLEQAGADGKKLGEVAMALADKVREYVGTLKATGAEVQSAPAP
jgi:hypothetical protein